ncbi:MAG: SpoIIE family protein phosphatase [Spirochaetes bacterium]|nr:SpoIIE family protein phosphatase [Spirochaetota bacterium]
MKSLSSKISIAYIFLTIINISFFIFIIFENKMNYITQITKYQVKENAEMFYDNLSRIFYDINKDIKKYEKNEKTFFISLKINLEDITKDFIVYKEDGELLFRSSEKINLDKGHLNEAKFAIANKDFSGKSYHSKINDKNYEVFFYYPIENFEYSNKLAYLNDSIITFSLEITEIRKILLNLYKMAFFIVLIITLIHILFIFVLHYLLISPLKIMDSKSTLISLGDYSARININRKDEIGKLANSFNIMASSVQDTITQLNNKNEEMLSDLKTAGRVQKAIYPGYKNTNDFNLSIYHSPFTYVSGDYHDIFRLKNNLYGFLVADVSGHGVQAALVTMRLKEVSRRLAPSYDTADNFLMALNNQLSDLLSNYDSYFTAFYIVYNPINHSVSYSNGSHCKAFIVSSDTGGIKSMEMLGPMLGVSSDLNTYIEAHNENVKKGDKLILLTDGIIEARNSRNERLDYKLLLDYVKKHHQKNALDMLKGIIIDFKTFKGSNEKFDDETMMIIEIK